ncbi:MAG: helix-turn-helix domain-containing protein, partial [Chloroflexota bacterium]
SRPRRRGDSPLRPIGHGPAHPADQAARAFGRLLVAYREARGLSQRELAERLGWEQPNLARLEAGTHTPTLATLNRIAGRLGIEVILRIAPEGIDVETQERPM